MGAAVSIEIDKSSLRQFQNAIQTYHLATRKDIPEVVNRAALNLAFRSAQFTQIADRQAIKSMKGVRNPYALVNWNYTQQNKPHPKRKQMDAAVRKFFNSRSAAAGFFRRGWVEAGRKIQEATGLRPGVRVTGIGRRKGWGRATPAREALRSFALITNYAASKTKGSGEALVKFGGEGLKKAVNFVANDMLTYAQKKLAKRAQEFSRK